MGIHQTPRKKSGQVTVNSMCWWWDQLPNVTGKEIPCKWRLMARKINYEWGLVDGHAWRLITGGKIVVNPTQRCCFGGSSKETLVWWTFGRWFYLLTEIRVQPEHMTETSVSPRLRMSFYTILRSPMAMNKNFMMVPLMGVFFFVAAVRPGS